MKKKLVVFGVISASILTAFMAFAADSKTVTVDNTAANPVPVTGNVSVTNLPAVQPVSGSVTVANLPAVQKVSGSVTVTSPTLIHADGLISLSSNWNERYMTIPSNAVITDVRIERFLSGPESCEIWIEETAGGFFSPVTMFHLSTTQPVGELHLHSGFAPKNDTTERGFFMNADCYARVFWSGYLQ